MRREWHFQAMHAEHFSWVSEGASRPHQPLQGTGISSNCTSGLYEAAREWRLGLMSKLLEVLGTLSPRFIWSCSEWSSTRIADAPGRPFVKETACLLRFLFGLPSYSSLLSSRYLFQHHSLATVSSPSPHGGASSSQPRSRFMSWKMVGLPIAPLPIISPSAPVFQAVLHGMQGHVPIGYLLGYSALRLSHLLRPVCLSGISLSEGPAMNADPRNALILQPLAYLQAVLDRFRSRASS